MSPSNNEVKTICSANVRRMNDMYKEDDSTSAAVLVEDGSFSWGADAPILNQLVFVFWGFSHKWKKTIFFFYKKN